jgi:pepF/M3 family oligoendopeptidase
MIATLEMPRWDMSVVFPGFDSPEFAAEKQAILADLAGLEALFDLHRIDKTDAPTGVSEAFDAVAGALNAFYTRLQPYRGYVFAHTATDSRDERAQAELSELQMAGVRLHRLSTRFTAWVGSLDLAGLLRRSELAHDHEYALQKAQIEAKKLMSPAEEALAAELGPTGATAWAKLHGNYSSQILVPVEIKGRTEELPMSAVRNLAYEPDPTVRKAGYEAELAAWKQHELPLAAAMNGVKGETNVLCRKRGWASPLDEALLDAAIDQATLDAMMGAARESFPAFRRYLRAKARALGHSGGLPWHDLFAPVVDEGEGWPVERAERFIAEHFGGYSQKMGAMAERSFRESWIDWGPRPGKRDGAFCMGLRADESRVLMNYQPTFKWVGTLAHELGHAYHNLCLHGRTPLQKDTPMTLAETASIFCEQIVRRAAIQGASREERLTILEASLMGACQVVVDITSRFQFESQVLEKRQTRELSAAEMCAIMEQAQRDTYGDGLDEARLHPYMWAAKPHYYGRSYYNFPYMFGLLFGLGLYVRYEADPEGFRAGYDDLLSSTGMADAKTLGARFGIDVASAGFWRGSLGVIEREIDEFESLI